MPLGLVCGLSGALPGGRIMASMLHEVKPFEPVLFAATTPLPAAIALVACYVPARRAARLNPMVALGYEVGAMRKCGAGCIMSVPRRHTR